MGRAERFDKQTATTAQRLQKIQLRTCIVVTGRVKVPKDPI